MNLLWILFTGGVNGYLIYRFTGCLIDYKENRILRILLAAGFGIAGETIIYAGDAFNVCGALALCLLLIFLCTEGEAEAKAAAVMITFPLMMAMNYAVNNFPPYYNALLQDTHSIQGIYTQFYFFAAAGIKCGAWVGLYCCFRKKLVKVKHYMERKNWRYVVAIGTCSFISIVAAIVSPPAVWEAAGDNIRWSPPAGWLVVAAAVITDLGMLSLLPHVIESVYLKQEVQKAGIREAYYLSLEEQQKQVRKLRHDMNGHLQMIQAYLAAGNMEKARGYMENLDLLPLHCGGRNFCADTALNAMLNSCYDRLLEAAADVHFNLDIPEITGIETFDLCTIFSNSLDNAIEAVLKIAKAKDRRVTLKARYEKGCFSYKLVNSKCNEIREEDGIYRSDKEGENHGYGIENIKEIIQKYEGNMYIEYTEQEFCLFLYI